MSLAALQKLLHILSNKTTAQFYMSVRSEQDGCRVVCTIHLLLPKHKPCTNWDCHTWCRIIVIWKGSFFFWFLKIQETQGKHLTRKSSLLKTWMSHFKLSQDLDESFSSLQDLDESFSTLSRLGWVIFKSSRLGWGLTSLFGFLNSKGFRKLKESTWLKGAQAGSWRETRLD